MTFLLANFSCGLKDPRKARGNRVTEKVALVEKPYLCESLTRRNNGTDLWIVSCEVAARRSHNRNFDQDKGRRQWTEKYK